MMLTLILALATAVTAPTQDATAITLNTACPPSFEHTAANTCQLVTRYDAYDSLHNKGVGGTQTSLPKVRDGFSPQQIDLGRYLFFDPLLSGNHRQACASCHQPAQGFADGKAVSTGTHGDIGTRSAPGLWNVGFLKKLFWDARADSLEQQALIPLFAPHEMANTAEQLLADLTASRQYPALFAQAFPDSAQLELSQVATALAAFQSSLISLNSRYDQYAHGYHEALNEEEIKGLNVFRSFVARCAECHTPPLFTNQQIAVIGTPEPAGMPFDQGAGDDGDKSKLRGAFKVPSLRNIARTAPYMHSGRFATLEEATEFYTKGRGHAVAEQKLLLHWHIWEPKLTPEEIGQISKFLHSLTDESLMPIVPTQLPSGLPLPAEILSVGTEGLRTPTDSTAAEREWKGLRTPTDLTRRGLRTPTDSTAAERESRESRTPTNLTQSEVARESRTPTNLKRESRTPTNLTQSEVEGLRTPTDLMSNGSETPTALKEGESRTPTNLTQTVNSRTAIKLQAKTTTPTAFSKTQGTQP